MCDFALSKAYIALNIFCISPFRNIYNELVSVGGSNQRSWVSPQATNVKIADSSRRLCKEIICSHLQKESQRDAWIIHPLPALVVLFGNTLSPNSIHRLIICHASEKFHFAFKSYSSPVVLIQNLTENFTRILPLQVCKAYLNLYATKTHFNHLHFG